MFKRPRPNRKGVVPDHLKDRFRYLDGLAPTTALGPWRELAFVAIGGLQHIGFAPKSDQILVISTTGRGVIDGATGTKIGRTEGEYYPDCGSLEADGIGPLDGQRIRVAGIYGGGLPRTTEDGWLIEPHPLSWPEEELFLCPPGQTMLWNSSATEPALFKLRPRSPLTAYGFSPTGKLLVIATSSDLQIYGLV